MFQYALFESEEVQSAVHEMADSSAKERGAVHTRREVVDFILDLIGYTPDAELSEMRILEPSFGAGEFVLAVVDRLVDSYCRHGGRAEAVCSTLRDSLRAVEVNRVAFRSTRRRVVAMLVDRGVLAIDAAKLADRWLLQADFLLAELPDAFTHIVGNPPYVRQELIPSPLIQEYRRRYKTIYDRADLYIPFIERGLRLLAREGVLAFICSDRWVKNRYGGPLRKLISEGFHLQHYVDMVDTPAFDTEVTAYPGIFVISRAQGTTTQIARKPKIDSASLKNLAQSLRAGGSGANVPVQNVTGIVKGSEPWLLGSEGEVALLRRLEGQFPRLESAGCRVGIGVATGADKVYIRQGEDLPVEKSRKLPLIMAPDIRSGEIKWSGKYLLNPFEQDGTLARFEKNPRFAAYVKVHESKLRARHVAKKNPRQWYRTIDRVCEELTLRPKLLIPDIGGSATIVYDKGQYYPHHNLYYVTSEEWDLRALQSVLRSSIAEFFVAMYCVKMQGGYLRFQAQYIRRIRLPRWETVPPNLRKRLQDAAEIADRSVCDVAAFELYGLDFKDQEQIGNLVYEAESA